MSEESDIAVLKEQLESLRMQVAKDEIAHSAELRAAKKDFGKKLDTLSTALRDIQAKIRTGRGIFIGIFFTLGTIGFAAADKISAAIMKWTP
jgi:hypothetical protein